MSKLKLILPGGKSFTLSADFIKSSGKLDILVNIINTLSVGIFSLFIFLIPVSGSLFSLDFETSILRFLIIFILSFLLIFLLKLIFQGSSFVIDPKGLLIILIFNLVLTASTLSITVIKVSGTFGVMGFRYLSGLTLMSLIGLFYFLNLYSPNTVQIKRILNLFVGGTFLYLVLSLINSNTNSATIINALPLLVVGFTALVALVLSSKNKVVGSFLVLGYILMSLILLPFSQSTYYQLFIFTICIFISSSLGILLYWSKSKKEFAKRFSQIKTNISNFIEVKKAPVPTIKGLSDLHFLLVYISPIIILLVSMFFYFSIPVSTRTNIINTLTTPYADSIKLITAGTYSINTQNIRSILLGVGSDNYSAAWPFLANVITVTGFIGSTIYIFLWFYFIKIAKENFLRSIKDRSNFKLTGLLLFVSLFLPLVLLVNYGGILNLVVLWVVYGISSSLRTPRITSYLSNNIERSSTRFSTILKIVISVVLIVLAWNVLTIALSLIK